MLLGSDRASREPQVVSRQAGGHEVLLQLRRSVCVISYFFELRLFKRYRHGEGVRVGINILRLHHILINQLREDVLYEKRKTRSTSLCPHFHVHCVLQAPTLKTRRLVRYYDISACLLANVLTYVTKATARMILFATIYWKKECQNSLM